MISKCKACGREIVHNWRVKPKVCTECRHKGLKGPVRAPSDKMVRPSGMKTK